MRYDPTSDTIYLPGNAGVWRLYLPCPILPATSYRVGFSQHSVSPFPPPLSATHWTLVDHIGQGPLFAFGSAPSVPGHPPTPLDLSHTLEDLGHSNWPLQYSHFPLEGTHLALAILLGQAHGVCDGSYMPSLRIDLGAAAWFLEDSLSPGLHTCYGSLHSTGGPGISNAYRAELQGMHAMLLATQSICTAFSLTSGKVTLGCDNLGVISQLRYPKETISCSCKHADLIRACQGILHLLPIQVSLVHVRGHQNSQLPFEALDRLAQLNSMADDLAKQHLLLAISQSIPSLPIGPLAGESWWCSLPNGTKLTSDPQSPVLFALSSPQVQEYLSRHNLLPALAFPLVNWDAIGQASASSPPLYRLWISKFASGHSAVGHMMFKRKEWDNDLCPCCGHSPETTRHVISCQDPQMSATFHAAVTKFSLWLQAVETHPSIHACFVATLSSHQALLFCPSADPTTLPAAQDQDLIGWENFLLGQVSLKWSQIQEAYLNSCNSRH